MLLFSASVWAAEDSPISQCDSLENTSEFAALILPDSYFSSSLPSLRLAATYQYSQLLSLSLCETQLFPLLCDWTL